MHVLNLCTARTSKYPVAAILPTIKIVKLGDHSHQRPRMLGFLKLFLLAHWYVCVSPVCLSVCQHLRELITSSMIWCDIGCV